MCHRCGSMGGYNGSQDAKAIALRYRQAEDEAPVVVAKGQGLIAEAILELAARQKVPTVADPDLYKLLEGVEVSGYIPPGIPIDRGDPFIWRLRKDGQAAFGWDLSRREGLLFGERCRPFHPERKDIHLGKGPYSFIYLLRTSGKAVP